MYNDFAKFYDILMEDADYIGRTEYILSLFERFGGVPTLLLDLACGTGEFSNEFTGRGISVIGVDISEEMLCVAREKSEAAGNDILYVCQDAKELDLFGRVDGAICCLDSLNHIIDFEDFCRAIERVALFLEEEKLFIFDVNTVYKHREVLGDNTFVLEEEGVYCVWQNFYNPEDNTVDITLDFFEGDGENYKRLSEDITERAYTESEIEAALERAGLEVLAVYGDMTYESPNDTTDRAVYVTRKMKING
ncbi:MAG: methyltransferase domain-containing protein [Clostridia bacterium]|nr:methyltransferase domain-containing protein [Clostridia bacterium]